MTSLYAHLAWDTVEKNGFIDLEFNKSNDVDLLCINIPKNYTLEWGMGEVYPKCRYVDRGLEFRC